MSVTSTKFSDDFHSIVQTNAKSVALIDSRSEEKVTYADLEKRVSQMEEFLSNFGFDNEKRLLMLLPNSLDTLLIFLAVAEWAGHSYLSRSRAHPQKLKTCWPRLDLTILH